MKKQQAWANRTAFNRTRLELKRHFSYFYYFPRKTFNRTRLELKLTYNNRKWGVGFHF